MFSHPKSHSKISNIMITKLFYSRTLNMNKGSFHTRSFRRIHFPFLDTDELKIALRARKVSGAFEKRAPEAMKEVNARPGQTEFVSRPKFSTCCYLRVRLARTSGQNY